MGLVVGVALVSLLLLILPSLSVGTEFFSLLDAGIALFIRLVDFGRWFIPLDVFVLCLGVIFVIDHWGLIMRIVQYVVDLIRG